MQTYFYICGMLTTLKLKQQRVLKKFHWLYLSDWLQQTARPLSLKGKRFQPFNVINEIPSNYNTLLGGF